MTTTNTTTSTVQRFFRIPGVSATKQVQVLKAAQSILGNDTSLKTEICFNVETCYSNNNNNNTNNTSNNEVLTWLLSETFEPNNFSTTSFLLRKDGDDDSSILIEVGPRLNFTSAFSTNAVSICHSCGLTNVKRIELSRRYLVSFSSKPSGINQSINQSIITISNIKLLSKN